MFRSFSKYKNTKYKNQHKIQKSPPKKENENVKLFRQKTWQNWLNRPNLSSYSGRLNLALGTHTKTLRSLTKAMDKWLTEFCWSFCQGRTCWQRVWYLGKWLYTCEHTPRQTHGYPTDRSTWTTKTVGNGSGRPSHTAAICVVNKALHDERHWTLSADGATIADGMVQAFLCTHNACFYLLTGGRQ